MTSRSFAHFGVILIILCHATLSVADAIDPERLKAAEARAQSRWSDGGYDRMPSYDSAKLAGIAGDKSRTDILDVIAQVLSSENPTKSGAVVRYLNDTLEPFILKNKGRYLCITSQYYYNSDVSTEEIVTRQDYGETWIFDLTFWLIQTEAPRKRAQLGLPESYNRILKAQKSYVEQHGWTTRGDTVHLDCAHTLSQRPHSPEEGVDG